MNNVIEKRREPEYVCVMKNPDNLLEIEDLKAYFCTDEGMLKAVDGVTLGIERGKTVCLVGESGCGKSVTGLAVMRLLSGPQGQITGGSIRFARTDGRCVDLARLPEKEMRLVRGGGISMVFQEPSSAFDPVRTVGFQLGEALRGRNKKINKNELKEKCLELFELVRIPEPERVYGAYPHELSGGMLQRAAIAAAVCQNPSLIIADEPTTALDVTVQAHILSLLRELRDKTGAAILLITHDLGVVAETADYVAVMYAGRIVEQGGVSEIFYNPLHPYTRGLLKARPANAANGRLYQIPGNVPSPVNLPGHCYFMERCAMRADICGGEYPEPVNVTKTHTVSCRLWRENEGKARGE